MKLCRRCQSNVPHGHAWLAPDNPTGCSACAMRGWDQQFEVWQKWMAGVDEQLAAIRARLDQLEEAATPF